MGPRIAACSYIYYWGPCSEAAGNLCVSTFSYWGPCSEAAGNLCVSTFSYYYYWGPCSEAAGNPVCFLPFLIIIIGAHAAKLQGTLCVSTFSLLGPMQRSCREPCVFLPFLIIIIIIIIIIPLSSAMGCLWQPHRTVCQKVVKFGTQVKDSCMFQFHPSYMSPINTL